MSIQRNTTYNLIGSLLSLAVYVITVPIYLNTIGEIRYGIMTLVWLMLGYIGLFDLGLGTAVAQKIATIGKKNITESAKIFWTALIINITIGSIIAIIIWPITSHFINNSTGFQDEIRRELIVTIPWIMIALPVATLSSLMNGALQGCERFLELNIINIAGTILSQVLPLFAIKLWGENLVVLILSALMAKVIAGFVLYVVCKKNIVQGQPIKLAKEYVRSLLRFGGWATVTSFISPIISMIDRIIVGAMLGAKQLTLYTVPLQLAEKITLIPNAYALALFPRMSSLSDNEANEVACNGIRVLAMLITPLAAAGIILMKPVLSLWINEEFAERSTVVGQIILIGFWINGLARVPYFRLMSKARPDLIAKCHLIQAIPYFLLLYILLSRWGLLGGAIAFAIRAMIDYILLAKLASLLKDSKSLLCAQVLILLAAIIISIIANHYDKGWLVLLSIYLPIQILWLWIKMPEQIRAIAIKTKHEMINRFKQQK